MSWEFHARGTHENGSHVKIGWRGLNAVHDVWVDCPTGVQRARTTPADLFRDEMNAFSRPIEAYFQWSSGDERPFVRLYWTDEGEECQQTVFLDAKVGHGSSARSGTAPAGHGHLRALTDRLLHPSRSF
jgi:hypothetical protein